MRVKLPATQADALLARARRVLSDHRTRAKQDGAVLDYTLAGVRRLLAAHPQCEYCRAPLSLAASLDHRQPIARGGRHTLGNLAVCCSRCNGIKGQLAEGAYRALLTLLAAWHPTARADVEKRLFTGGKRYSSNRRGRV